MVGSLTTKLQEAMKVPFSLGMVHDLAAKD